MKRILIVERAMDKQRKSVNWWLAGIFMLELGQIGATFDQGFSVIVCVLIASAVAVIGILTGLME